MPDDEPTEEEIIESYLEMRRSGVGERQAARFFGVSHREIMAYADTNPGFALALEDAIHERLERVEAAVWTAGQAGDMNAAKMVVESHAPEKWVKPTPEMILSFRAEGPMSLEEVSDLKTKLEAAQRQQALRASSIDVESEEVTDA